MEEERTQGQNNADAYRQGMNDAATRRNFDRPSRHYPTEEQQTSYEMGFYNELEAMEEENEMDGGTTEGP